MIKVFVLKQILFTGWKIFKQKTNGIILIIPKRKFLRVLIFNFI